MREELVNQPSRTELLQRVRECNENNHPIDYKLHVDLANATGKNLSWDIFYEILKTPQEAETGYWNATNVASALLMPVIRKMYNSNRNNRINESVNEDFLSNVKMAIQECIPGFDKDLSHFPNYIKLYIAHVGYTYNKDSSPYMEKTTGIRIFSQNAISDNSQPSKDANYSKDPYANTKSNFKIEEELEKRDKLRNSSLFSNMVIRKRSLNDSEHEQGFLNAAEAKAKKEKLLLDMDRITKWTEKHNSDDVIKINGEEYTKKEAKEYVARVTKEKIEKYDKIIDQDFNQTIINASYWKLFLGGFTNFPERVKEDIVREINDDREDMEDER